MKSTEQPPIELVAESGLYRVAGWSAAEFVKHVQAMGWRAAHINAAAIDSKAGFLAAAGRALQLPAWFGHNWDAFEECLRDLPDAEGYLICIEEPANFARSRPHEWRIALSILREAADFWSKRNKPFYVLLTRTRGAAPAIPLIS